MHFVTGSGANIHEIQTYDRDSEQIFAMLLRIEWPGPAESVAESRRKMDDIGGSKGLSIRTWSRDAASRPPRLALCTTFGPSRCGPSPGRRIQSGRIAATPAVMIGNREACRGLAEQYHIDWHSVGDKEAKPDNERLVELLDRYEVDYVVLARYMRILPPSVCWQFAGGRILNLHHGLSP